MNETLRWLLDLKVIPADAEGIRLAFERPLERWVWALLIIGAGLFAVWLVQSRNAGAISSSSGIAQSS